MIQKIIKNLSLPFLAFVMALSVFAGCSGSSGSSGQDQGEVAISLTDAKGDFITYAVDVKSVILTRANGEEIQVLAEPTTVDFAQYVDVLELLTSAHVPLGAYTKATLVLDYSNADIRVENSEGAAVQVETIEDGEGHAITELSVSVYLENQCALVVSPGLIARLSLDFDLKTSNTVAFSLSGNASLVVEPNLIAEIDKETPKAERVRGLLDTVNVDESYFDINICPFLHHFKNKKHGFGHTRIYSMDDTVFEINGVGYVGDEGLEALSDIDEDTPVIVKGNMNMDERKFEAREVYVGSSVPGVIGDAVTGSVVGRSGNTLQVNGMVSSQIGSYFRLNDTVTVTLSEDTVVKKQGSTEVFSIDDIAPGQNIWITGDLSMTESETLALDATEGSARLLVTVLRGHVAEDLASPYLNIDLGTINLRKAELFDFTGTGMNAAGDADPLSYEVETGDLDTSVFNGDDPIKVYGFVNAFGAAPYDFQATKLVNYVTLPALLSVKWIPSTLNPFESMDEEGLMLDLSGQTVFHLLLKADIRENDEEVTLVPAEQGVYVIKMSGRPYIFTDFTKFVEKLDTLLDGSNRMKRLFATGGFDRNNKTLATSYLTVDIR